MSEITISGPVALLPDAGAAVYFSKTPANAGTSRATGKGSGTALPVQKLQNELNVAFWGEDNRFPQNIEQQMAYCGIGKFGLDWKARAIYGNGILPGRITGYKEDGSEIFQPLSRDKDKAIYSIIEKRTMFRFWMEYLQDWTWYGNCFPEAIFSNDAKTITGFVHQESCDARYQQMNKSGDIEKVYLSKLWGASAQQYARFDPKKIIRGLMLSPSGVDQIPKEFIKTLHCIDMYDPVQSAKEIADKLRAEKKPSDLKSAIYPVNYPSVNKTYYQVPAWDGARLAGWVEIACKIPSMLKALYSKAFRIRYHIEIPENYFERKFGVEIWLNMTETEQTEAKKELLKEMQEFLSGAENAYKSFVSFFEITKLEKDEVGRIKITEISDKSNLDKEMITQSAADTQILVSMGLHPTIIGAGGIGTGQMRSGGSDKRESHLIQLSQLVLEREVAFEPLYLMRDYNGWDDDIVFRVRDTVLTTLDTGAGTKKVLS